MKTLVIIAAGFLLWGCTGNSRQEAGEPAHQHPNTDSTVTVKDNQGKKWETDQPTRKHANAIKQLLHQEKYAGGKNGTELSGLLQAELDLMVAECTMKGPAHEALHTWLQGMLQHLSAFKKGGSESAAAFEAMRRQSEEFDRHFQ